MSVDGIINLRDDVQQYDKQKLLLYQDDFEEKDLLIPLRAKG